MMMMMILKQGVQFATYVDISAFYFIACVRVNKNDTK